MFKEIHKWNQYRKSFNLFASLKGKEKKRVYVKQLYVKFKIMENK